MGSGVTYNSFWDTGFVLPYNPRLSFHVKLPTSPSRRDHYRDTTDSTLDFHVSLVDYLMMNWSFPQRWVPTV